MPEKAGASQQIKVNDRTMVARDINWSNVMQQEYDKTACGDVAKQYLYWGTKGDITWTGIDSDDLDFLLALNGTSVTVTEIDNSTGSPVEGKSVAGTLQVPISGHATHTDIISFPVVVHPTAIPAGLYPA